MSVESLTIATEAATRRRLGVTAAMAALVVLLALISLGIGPVRLSPLRSRRRCSAAAAMWPR